MVPIFPADVHEVHAGAVAEINRRDFARQQRGHERTDQRDVRGLGVGLGLGLAKFADLRAGEALERVRAGARGGELDAAQFLANFGAFLGGGGIHPDGRGLAGEHAVQVFVQRFLGIQTGQHRRGLVVEINGAVLLAAAADGQDSAPAPRLSLFIWANKQVEGGGPEPRRTVLDQRVAVGQHAVAGFELRQRLVEVQGFFIDHLARVEVNDDSAQALCAGIQSEKKF